MVRVRVYARTYNILCSHIPYFVVFLQYSKFDKLFKKFLIFA